MNEHDRETIIPEKYADKDYECEFQRQEDALKREFEEYKTRIHEREKGGI